MLGKRDVIWSVAICAVITLFAQCRPAWSARRFIEREAQAGFEQAFAGHRYLSGEVVIAASGGAYVDPAAPAIAYHAVEISAERVAWNGSKAEFVVHHRIELESDNDATQDVHVQIRKQNGSWIYDLFEVRGAGELSDPNQDNPWARALRDG